MAFGRGAAPYTNHRIPLYILLWLTSVALLGLTAFRIHKTRQTFGFFDKIIVELLVTSILTILWIPYAIYKVIRQRATNGGTAAGNATSGHATSGHVNNHHDGAGARHPSLRNELGGNLLLWIMWLVGAAVTTHKWPSRFFCGAGFQCRILEVIVALAWIGFSLLTLIKILSLMQHAAAYGGNYYHGNGAGYAGNGVGTGAGTGYGSGTTGVGTGAGIGTGTGTGTGTGILGDKHGAHTGPATTGAGYA